MVVIVLWLVIWINIIKGCIYRCVSGVIVVKDIIMSKYFYWYDYEGNYKKFNKKVNIKFV